jgi:hypothetical protein
MSTIKTVLAYTWALLAVPVILVIFIGSEPLAGKLVAITGLHVHPAYTGGEIIRTLDHGGYRTLIHRPVFDGLIGQRDRGSIRIEWQQVDANLPESVDERIDFDADGSDDFAIRLNTTALQASLQPLDPRVLSVGEVVAVPKGRVVTVNLQRKPPGK